MLAVVGTTQVGGSLDEKTDSWDYWSHSTPNCYVYFCCCFIYLDIGVINMIEAISNCIAIRKNPILVEFRNYVLSFYAYDGLYPIESNSVSRTEQAIQEYVKRCSDPSLHQTWGGGDSLDRERVGFIIEDILNDHLV